MRALIPNTLSLSNLVLGFSSILVSSRYSVQPDSGFLFLAAVMILIAALCDGFDGPAARLLKVAEGGIGAQLDTLADLTTFGIAPGVLLFHAYFHELGAFKLFGLAIPGGMLLSALFPVTAAYRLARFNLSHDPYSFSGLPSPIAGIVIALFIMARRGDYQTEDMFYIIPVYCCLAFLMVSTLKYSKPQKGIRSQFAPVRLILLLLFLGGLTFVLHFKFIEIMMSLLGLYIFSGLATFIILTIKRLKF